MIDLTRMFSDSPGTPGRRQQMPRTISSMATPALRRFVERVDDVGIDQRVHLHPDRRRLAVLGMGDLAGDVRENPVAQRQRRHRHLLDVRRLGVAGDVIEHARDIAADDLVGREVGQVGIDARGHRMVIAGAGMNVGREAAAFATHHQRQLGVGLELEEAIDDLHAGAFEIARPADVGFFVEARLQFDQRRDGLAGIGGLDQRAHDRRVVARCDRASA